MNINNPTTVVIKPSEVKTPIQVNVQQLNPKALADAIDQLGRVISQGLPTSTVIQLGGVVAQGQYLNQSTDLAPTVVFVPTVSGLYQLSVYGSNPTFDASAANVGVYWELDDGVSSGATFVGTINMNAAEAAPPEWNPICCFLVAGQPVSIVAASGGVYGAATWSLYYAISQLFPVSNPPPPPSGQPSILVESGPAEKISDMPLITSPANNDIFPLLDAGVNSGITFVDLEAALPQAILVESGLPVMISAMNGPPGAPSGLELIPYAIGGFNFSIEMAALPLPQGQGSIPESVTATFAMPPSKPFQVFGIAHPLLVVTAAAGLTMNVTFDDGNGNTFTLINLGNSSTDVTGVGTWFYAPIFYIDNPSTRASFTVTIVAGTATYQFYAASTTVY